MNTEIAEGLAKARARYERGEISSEEAWREAAPFVEKYNEVAKTIAKKYGRKPELIATKGSRADIRYVADNWQMFVK